MEKYQQTLNLVCDLLRVGEMDSGCFPRFNENPTKAYSEVTDKDYEILRELNYYDILFYEKVLLEFDRRSMIRNARKSCEALMLNYSLDDLVNGEVLLNSNLVNGFWFIEKTENISFRWSGFSNSYFAIPIQKKD